MLFMVIEHFKNGDARAVYRRYKQKGRMLPDGLSYVGSWVDTGFERCFQLMECDDVNLFEQWTDQWQDLIEFEVTRVFTSEEAAAAITAMS